MSVFDHTGLKVWQRGIDLALEVYRITDAFPRDERFGLTSQLRRAGVSIPSNIAEGNGRLSTKEYVHHLSMSRGSLREVHTQMVIAVRRSYTREEELAMLYELLDHEGRMLTRMIKGLQAKTR